jgi:hypothetical protein
MKDAIIAAAEELGRIDFDKWRECLKGDPENGLKQFFKTLAVNELRTFGIILARIMPLHVQTNAMPAYMTEEQAIAELKTYGLPADLINHLHSVDEDEIDKEDIGNPYGDPDEAIGPFRTRAPAKHAGQFSETNPPPRPGRPKGSLNRITRTMKDAVVAAAEELGQIDFDKWKKHLKGDAPLVVDCDQAAVRNGDAVGVPHRDACALGGGGHGSRDRALCWEERGLAPRYAVRYTGLITRASLCKFAEVHIPGTEKCDSPSPTPDEAR